MTKERTKARMLRELIMSTELTFLMEAHNGLSAKIVAEADFRGIWASGLTISASLGVRDNNEASWTQIVDVVEFMNDNVEIPILLDGDTGYGNFNSVRRLIRKLEQRGIAGVCIEDKLFPKTNSFLGSEHQPLATIEEFCGKLKAAKDSRRDEDFVIVARTEAFIAGWGLEEALKRARAYTEAGADAIMVHSKERHAADLFAFMKHWDQRSPILVAPTAYYDIPTWEFERAGIRVVIWANQILRASVEAMQRAARHIRAAASLKAVEETIAPVAEIFRLQNVEEYRVAELKYLPTVQNVSAIILAASKGEGFGILTRDRPKCMLEINGKSILERQVATLNRVGIKDISVVVGYKRSAIRLSNLRLIENNEYARGSILVSYLKAAQHLKGACVISFGDILYETHILRDLLEQDGDIVLAVDTSWWQGYKLNREIDAVIGEAAPVDNYLHERCVRIKALGVQIPHQEAHGEWIGLMKLSREGALRFAMELQDFWNEGPEAFAGTDINAFLLRLMNRGIELKTYYFRGHWLDIDSPDDISFPAGEGNGLVY
jgi:phosphoenolpyruvate phosphomutase